MNNLPLFTAVVATFLVLTLGAPLSENGAVRADKRSDEVIFFDEDSPGSVLASKRSQKTAGWLDQLVQSSKGENQPVSVSGNNAAKINDKLVEEMEEEAFYDALSYIVKTIIDDDVHRYGYDLEDDENSMKTTKINEQDNSKEIEINTTPSITEGAAEPETESNDAEASQLENLIKSDKKAQIVSPFYEQLQKSSGPKAQTNEQPDASDQELSTTDSQEESSDRSGELELQSAYLDDYEDIVEYMEYLSTLKALETKLRSQLNQYQEKPDSDDSKNGFGRYEDFGSFGGYDSYKPEHEGYKVEEAHGIRKKRSLSDRVSDATELELFSGMRDKTEETEQPNDGVYFTVKEAEDLKQLLIELAKERLESEELVRYLLENLDELYRIDAPESESLVLDGGPTHYEPERPLSLYETEPSQYKRYQSRSDDGSLSQLASQLSSRYNSGYEYQKRKFWI